MNRDRLVRYLTRLYGYAFSLTQDRETARELVQDCALRALEARRVPADEPAFRAWLFTILRNASHDRRRRAGRSPEVAMDDAGEPPFDFDQADRLINTVTVRICMAKLTAEHREIIGLVDVAGFSYHEAASVLDVPPGTVMSRLSRARRALMNQVLETNVHVLDQPRFDQPRRRRAR